MKMPIYLAVDHETGVITDGNNKFLYDEAKKLLEDNPGKIDLTQMCYRFIFEFKGDLKRMTEFYSN